MQCLIKEAYTYKQTEAQTFIQSTHSINENDGVAAHLQGVWPTPSTDKDILKPNGKLKTLNTTD